MQFLEMLTPIFKITAFSVVAVYSAKIFISGYLYATKKAKLTKTNSKISGLKLKLKTRLNQKLNTIDSLISTDTGVTLEKIVSEIRELDFSKAKDYATLIEKFTEIVVTIRNEKALNTTPENQNVFQTLSESISPELDLLRNTYKDVFEFDRGVIICIIEIKNLTDNYIKYAKDFNEFVDIEKKEKKITDLPEPILIENLHLLEEIYNRQKAAQDYLKKENETPEDSDSEDRAA